MRSHMKIPHIQEDQAKEGLTGFFIIICNKHMKSQDQPLPHFTLSSSAGLETKVPRKVDARGHNRVLPTKATARFSNNS